MTFFSRLNTSNRICIAAALALAVGSLAGLSSWMASAAPSAPQDFQSAVPNEPSGEPGIRAKLDRSGRRQVGKASFYAARYAGKTMADGTPMQLYSNNAASITLPLGTIARVTNLETGRSANITIRDRGPYVKGRIVDLSPATARVIGISAQKGVARVAVTPISIPPSGTPIRLASLNNRRHDW